MVTHPSTNRAQRRLTSWIKTNALHNGILPPPVMLFHCVVVYERFVYYCLSNAVHDTEQYKITLSVCLCVSTRTFRPR